MSFKKNYFESSSEEYISKRTNQSLNVKSKNISNSSSDESSKESTELFSKKADFALKTQRLPAIAKKPQQHLTSSFYAINFTSQDRQKGMTAVEKPSNYQSPLLLKGQKKSISQPTSKGSSSPRPIKSSSRSASINYLYAGNSSQKRLEPPLQESNARQPSISPVLRNKLRLQNQKVIESDQESGREDSNYRPTVEEMRDDQSDDDQQEEEDDPNHESRPKINRVVREG